MGSSFSVSEPKSAPSSSDPCGFTRIAPACHHSLQAPKPVTGTIRVGSSNGDEVPLPQGGHFSLAPSQSTPEIAADSNGIQLTDVTNRKLHLEGTLEITIAEFPMKTRKFVTKGEHGFGIGIDTKLLDQDSFHSITNPDGTLLLEGHKESQDVKLKIRTSNKNIRIIIDPINTCGIVWIRFLTPK